MRFTDFLKATVMLSMAAATMLAVFTVVGASREFDPAVTFISAGWWLVAAGVGTWLGRGGEVASQIGRLLAQAKVAKTMPEHRPGAVLLNRLWPLLLLAVAAAAASLLFPQVAGVATGFAIIWSLAWRHQASAVLAIEERDGVAFFVVRTSPVKPMVLERAPGLRRETPTFDGSAPG